MAVSSLLTIGAGFFLTAAAGVAGFEGCSDWARLTGGQQYSGSEVCGNSKLGSSNSGRLISGSSITGKLNLGIENPEDDFPFEISFSDFGFSACCDISVDDDFSVEDSGSFIGDA